MHFELTTEERRDFVSFDIYRAVCLSYRTIISVVVYVPGNAFMNRLTFFDIYGGQYELSNFGIVQNKPHKKGKIKKDSL